MIIEKYYKTLKVRKDKAVTIPPAVQAALGIDDETELELEYNRADRSFTYKPVDAKKARDGGRQ